MATISLLLTVSLNTPFHNTVNKHMPRPLLPFVCLVLAVWSKSDWVLTLAASDSSSLAGDTAPDDTDTITDPSTAAERQALASINEADEAGQRQEHAFASMEDVPEPLSHPTFHAPEAHQPLLSPVDDVYTPNQDAKTTIATVNDLESADVTTSDMTLVSQSEDESENTTSKHDLGSGHNGQHQPSSSQGTNRDHHAPTDSHDEIVTTANARNVEVDDEQLQAAAESIKEAIRMTNPNHNVPTDKRDWNYAQTQTTASDETKHENGNGPGPSDKDNDTIRTDNDSSTLRETKNDNGEAVLEEDDDRTLLDIFGESAKEYLTQRVVRVSCILASRTVTYCNTALFFTATVSYCS
jgi:hypothetical protein